MSSRSIALENLIEILEKERPLHLVLSESLEKIPQTEYNDRAFVSRLTRGVTERKITLDAVINMLASVKVNKQKPVVRNILRSGIYQILFMNSVTDFAACDESVKLAGKRGFRSLGGFINGVLRSCCRRKSEIMESLSDMTLRYSMPEWIVKDWTQRFGKDKAERAFEYFFEDNGISIRCNLSKTDIASVEKSLGEIEGISIEKGLSSKCLKLKKCGSPDELPGFKQGLFTVQDESSVFAGLCLGIGKTSPEGIKILDLCAAPGGKAVHAADYPGTYVTACDISDDKCGLIREAVKRCGFNNIEVIRNDATIFNKDFENRFDCLICDLPCSGLGIIGKKPDIKYNMTPGKMKELCILQREILDNAVRYMKPGGVMVFSTCTVDTDENEYNVEYLINEKGLVSDSLDEYLPDIMRGETTKKGYIQILPGEFGCDGFFISRLIKKD